MGRICNLSSKLLANHYSPEECGVNGLILEYFLRNRDIKLCTNKDVSLDYKPSRVDFYDKMSHMGLQFVIFN